jgi:hypothetical protein
MWIRSQDGMELVKADCIKIDFIPALWARIYTHSNDRSRLMGEYNNEADAIAVLDMIHDHLCGADTMWSRGKVFQMPPKGFSKAGGDNHGTD